MNKAMWTAAFLDLRPVERLEQIDFLSLRLAELAYDVAAHGEDSTVHTLLEINHKLISLRESLAYAGDLMSVEIVGRAQTLVVGLQAMYDFTKVSATIH